MSKGEKSKFEKKLWLKEFSVFALVLAWGGLLVFKNDWSRPLRLLFALLLGLLTIGVLYWTNRTFLGSYKDKV